MSRANSNGGVPRRSISRFATIASIVAGIACLLALVGPAAVAADAAPSITAPYAVVVNADTGQVLYNKSMNTPTAPASLTKLFTTAVALDSTPLNTQMTVDQTDLVGEASMGLSAGETQSLQNLLYGMLLPSGNDAAMTIAENIGRQPGNTPKQAVANFVTMMNQLAQRLGLTGSTFKNPHGLDQPGHQTTARDIAAITMYLLKQPEFRTIIGTNMYDAGGHDLITANRLLGEYPGLIGGKTGITDNAGYCLMEVAQRDGHTVIAVVMKDTDAAWYDDATSLLDYGFSTLASGAVPAGLPKITLAQAAPRVTSVTNATTPANAKYKVDRVAAGTAVVSESAGPSSSSGLSWGWLLASIGAIVIALLAVFHREALLAYARETRHTWARIQAHRRSRHERNASARRRRNSE
ncbi:MAG TPA: D-alanyl-D-alanine carboxypeptidase family protein, partial [Thermomicrobiaceae bacterium]|nr:D-alanyl-D-alanine carboxypeptidase family protein [Thermomicrobiaceae bacterium]